MFLGMNIWCRITYWCVLPWETLFLLLTFLSCCVGLLPHGLPHPLQHVHCWAPPSTSARPLLLCLFSSCLGTHAGETWIKFLISLWHTISQQTLQSWGSYNLSPLFHGDSRALGVVVFYRGIHWDRDLQLCSLLSFSVMASICYKEKFLWGETRPALIHGNRNKPSDFS